MGYAKFASTRKKLTVAWQTEQNWQGEALKAVACYNALKQVVCF